MASNNGITVYDDDQHVSLSEIIGYNHSISGATKKPAVENAPLVAAADFNLTRNQIKELEASNPATTKTYDKESLEYAAALKRAIDDAGWQIKRYSVSHDGQELKANIASGAAQAQVVMASPVKTRLGRTYINHRTVYSNAQDMTKHNSPTTVVDKLMAPLNYFLGANANDVNAKTNVRLTKKGNAAVNLRNSRGNDGVFYVGLDNNFLRNSHETQMEYAEHNQPDSLEELIKQVNEKATANDEPNVVPYEQLLDQFGNVDLSRINTDYLIRYAEMSDIVRLLQDDALKRLQNGETLDDFRRQLVTDKTNEVPDETDDSDDSRNASDVVYQTEDDEAPSALAEAFAKAQDNLEVEEDDVGDDDTAEGNELDAQNIPGSRQRLANLMVGLEDSNHEPLAGRLPENAYTQAHKDALENAKAVAESSGVTDFDGYFDNDYVMHWQGVPLGGQEVNHHVIGQFFFPADHDITDDAGNIVVKKGVTPIKYGSGIQELRVGNFDATFMAASKGNGGIQSNYRHNLMTRLKVTGTEQKMNQALSASIRAQALTRFGNNSVQNAQDEIYDSTRLRNVYQGMTRLTPAAMLRPGVVEQARAAVRFDSSWLTRDYELASFEHNADGSVPENSKGHVDANHQSLRGVLQGMEGVFDEEASSDGKVLGAKRYFTTQFMDYLDNYGGETFAKTGTLGQDGQKAKRELVNGKSKIVKDANGKIVMEDTPLQAHFLNVPAATRNQYKAAVAEKLPYMKYDSPDRALMAMNMIMVAKDVIGGELDTKQRPKVKVALMTAGGQTFEDAIIVSKDAAEKNGWRVGDKLADTHSNKGTIGYIGGKDPSDPRYNADIEGVLSNNPDLEMIQSPYSMGTRANMGLAKELLDSKDVREVKDANDNVRGVQGELSIIVTNMEAEHKVKLYELQDLGRTRHFSYQQSWAVQAHGAEGVLNEVFKNNTRQHETLTHYLNAEGYNIDDDGVLIAGHRNMDRTQDSYGTTIEHPKDSELVVSPEEAVKLFPDSASYLELPMNLPVGNSETVQSRYVSILPATLRRDSETFDGQYIEHEYQSRLDVISDRAFALENMKVADISEHLDKFNANHPELNGLDEDGLNKAVKNRQPEMMDALASYENPDNAELSNAQEELRNRVNDYQQAVAGDQFGTDDRGKKYSYVRRHIVAADIPGSATAITTNDTHLPIDTIGLSPALAANLGLVDAIDQEKVDKALASGDMHEIQEAYRDNWKPSKNANDEIMAWRDPILHDGSIAGFKYEVNDELTGMAVNPMISEGFGLDFDGDQMGVYRPHTPEAQADLRDKMDIKHNLLDADLSEVNENSDPAKVADHLVLNIGMDNVDNFVQSKAGSAWLAKRPEFKGNGKKAVKYILGERVIKFEVERKNELDKQLTPEDKKAYAQAVNTLRNNPDAVLSADQQKTYDEVSKKYRDGINKRDEKLANVVNKFSKAYLANEAGSPSRYVDFRSGEAVQKSLENMMDSGAKGNPGSIKRAMQYYNNGVSIEDIASVRSAMAAKVDLTGKAGANMLRMAPILQNQNLNMDNALYFNGAQAAMDMAEPPTQAVLQIKHDPEKRPAVELFLNNFRQFSYGPKKEADDPVWIQLPNNVDDFKDIVNSYKDEKVTQTKFAADLKTATAMQKLQDYQRKHGDKPVYLDINNGLVSTSKDPNSRNNQSFTVDPESAYRVGLRTIYNAQDLNVSMKNVNVLQNNVRGKDGLLMSYDDNFAKKATAIDHLAIKGFEGVQQVAAVNQKAIDQQEPSALKRITHNDKSFGSTFGTNYERINDDLTQKAIKGKGQYELNFETLEAEMLLKKREQEQKQADKTLDAALGLGLDTEDITKSSIEEQQAQMQANNIGVSVSREMNGEYQTGPNVIDTDRGVVYDSKETPEEQKTMTLKEAEAKTVKTDEVSDVFKAAAEANRAAVKANHEAKKAVMDVAPDVGF